MNKTENAVIKYQVDFEKYKNGQANAIIELLDNASSEIAKYIRKTTGVYTKARYKEIAKKLKEISAKLKENVESGIDVDGVIDYELKKQSKILGTLKNDIMKVKNVGEVNFLYPSVEQIKTAALFKPITSDGYGMTWQSYLDGIESGFYNTWDVGVRTGYLTGQTTAQIVKSVMGGVSKIDKLTNPGSITSLRNSVYANTRTALQELANETMSRVYDVNEKYFGGAGSDYKYEYLATLDSRTCIICGSDDGRLYKTMKEVPHIPRHRGCRCVCCPYFGDLDDTRASKNGQVSSKLTFNDWLKEQDEATQKEVLGKTRFEIFKKGEKIDQFVDNGKVLKLDELKKKLENKETLLETFNNIYGNAKTIKEAEEELKHFGEIVTLPKNVDLETVNTVTKRLEYLTSKYPTKKLDYITFKKMSDSIGASSAYNQINVNSNLKAYNKNVLQPAEWQKFVDTNLGKLQEWKKNTEVKLNSTSDSSTKFWAQEAIKKYDKQIKQWTEYKNYLRDNVSYVGAEIESVVSHEYGHILADQKIGQINGYKANKDYSISSDNELYKKCKMCENVFKQAKKNKDIYKISCYGSSNVREFFAESFAIYSMGKEELPQYIVDMIEEVMK